MDIWIAFLVIRRSGNYFLTVTRGVIPIKLFVQSYWITRGSPVLPPRVLCNYLGPWSYCDKAIELEREKHREKERRIQKYREWERGRERERKKEKDRMREKKGAGRDITQGRNPETLSENASTVPERIPEIRLIRLILLRVFEARSRDRGHYVTMRQTNTHKSIADRSYDLEENLLFSLHARSAHFRTAIKKHTQKQLLLRRFSSSTDCFIFLFLSPISYEFSSPYIRFGIMFFPYPHSTKPWNTHPLFDDWITPEMREKYLSTTLFVFSTIQLGIFL